MGTANAWIRCHPPLPSSSTSRVDWFSISASNPPLGVATTADVPAGGGASFCHWLPGELMTHAERVPSALLMATARPPVGVTPVDVRLPPFSPPFRGRDAEIDQLFSPSALHKANSRRALPSPALTRAVTADGVATRRSTCDGPAAESGNVGPTDRQFPLTRSKMPGSAPWAHAAPTTSSPLAPKATAVSASTPHPAVELSAASPRVEATVVQFVRSPLLVTTSPPPLRRSASS